MKTNSLFCLRLCPSSSAVLWPDRGTCQTWVTYPELGPGLDLSLGPNCLDPPSPAGSWKESWARGKETPWTSLTGVWCFYVFLCRKAWISLLSLPEPKAKRKTVLKVMLSCFKKTSLRGSNWAFVSWYSTRERFQEGMPLMTFRSVSVEAIQETSEISIFADIYGWITQFAMADL